MIGLLFLAVQTDSFQTWLARLATNYLSKELDARISVGHVSIRFFNKAALKEVFVQDPRGDTLFWMDELVVEVGELSTKSRRLAISKLTIKDGFFNLVHEKGLEHDNLYFLLDYFSGDTAISADTSAWKLTAAELELDGFRFRYDDWNESEENYGIDFSHLDVYDAKGDFHDFHIINDSIFAKVDRLTFKEKSGFHVKEFTALAKVSDTQIRTQGLRIVSPTTELKGDLTFDYESWDDFEDFVTKVDWKGEFNNSIIDFNDIAFFTSELSGVDKRITVDGRFRGNVARFKANDLTLGWGERSFLKGNVFISGLPEMDETSMDIRIADAFTDVKDVEWLPMPPFDSVQFIRLPDNIRQMNEVRFKGRFTGLLTNFNAYGDFTTGLGYVSANLNVTYEDKFRDYIYKGKMSTKDFDIGRFTYTPGLGNTTFNLVVDGKGVRLNDVKATMDGKIERLAFNGYTYSDIDVNGAIAKKKFRGELETHGEDVDLVFNGGVDLSGKTPEFDFDARIDRLQLNRIHLLRGEEQYTLRTFITSDFTGNKIDNLEGSLVVSNTNLQVDQKMYHLNSVVMDAINLPDSKRQIKVVSDILDAEVEGAFRLEALPVTFREIIPRYLPNVLLPVKGDIQSQDFRFDIQFKNLSLISENYLPDLYVDPLTRIQGAVRGGDRYFDFKLTSPLLRYGPVRWTDLKTDISTGENALMLKMTADTLYYSEDGFVPAYSLRASAASNDVSFNLNLADLANEPNRLDWNGHMHFRSYSDFDLRIDTSELVIDGMPWLLDAGNKIIVDSNGISINDLSIRRSDEDISVNGRISKENTDELEVRMTSFSLQHLDPALRSSGINLSGRMSGSVKLSELFTSPVVRSDVRVEQLAVNGDTLGNLSLIADYARDKRALLINAGIVNGTAKVVDLSGTYLLGEEEDPLDFTLKTENFYVHAFENFTKDIVSDLRGKVTVDLTVKGSFEKPLVEGYAELRKVSATVDYLHTRYNVTSKIRISKDYIDLTGVKIYDQLGHDADISGGISHRNFSDFRLNVDVNARNLEVLNTTVLQNNYYYGNAFVSGFGSFRGPLESIRMEMNLSPDKGTKINIPFNTATEVTTSDFITFVKANTILDFEENTNRLNLSGFSLALNLDMNNNAEINLIFDEKIGDVISGSGNGDIKLEVTEDGNFLMNGTFTIETGSYLFTLQNLINKRFKVDPGGTVGWNGDPYNARIDMSAVYTTSTASLVNLIQDSTFQRRVNVDCRLNLKGALMNPTISYDISIKNQDATIENMVKTVLNSEQEINRQMFGLLVFNQFLPPSSSNASSARLDAGAGAVASASEMLSNQVSNWLSQLSKDVNIGFNYRAKDSYSNEEVQLMFSKTLFNDRLLVETNVGVTGNTVATANVSSSTNANSLVGEFFTEYKVSDDGRFRLKAYNRSNADDLINFNAPYTQGVGVSFRQDFNNWKDLRERLRSKKKKKDSDDNSEGQQPK